MLIKRLRLVKQHALEELVCEVEVHFFYFSFRRLEAKNEAVRGKNSCVP